MGDQVKGRSPKKEKIVNRSSLCSPCESTCSNLQTCTFEVRTLTQDCGFTSDPATSSITLSGEFMIIKVGIAIKDIFVYVACIGNTSTYQVILLWT